MKRETGHLLIALALGLGLSVALVWLLGDGLSTPVAHAAELHVCPSGCTYSSIQAAVDAAGVDDVIKVAGGIYTELHARDSMTQVVYISKTVTVRGGHTTSNWTTPDPVANPTTLDAHGLGRVLVIKKGGPTIEGLIITGGAGYYSGGGIYVDGADPVIQGNLIISNSASGDGGAIWVSGGSAQIRNNHIVSNTATWAGGLRIINNADATIVGNGIESNVAQISGGGIDVDCCGGTTPLVARNYIVNNDGGSAGGGVQVVHTHARVVNNILMGNQASDGAAILLEGMVSYPVSATLLHNTLVGGWAGGEGVWSGAYVTATLVNNIIVSHTVGISNTAPASSTVTADHTLFGGNGTDYGSGVSNIDEVVGDPAFVNPALGDYHIGRGSAAIDTAVDAGVNEDIDGQPRPIFAGYDVGADEYPRRAFLPLVLRNA
jgi:hypothetical protein